MTRLCLIENCYKSADDSLTDPATARLDEGGIKAVLLNLTLADSEGIETQEQLAFLRTRRCHEGQGYYFSRPLATNEYAMLLDAGIEKSIRKLNHWNSVRAI